VPTTDFPIFFLVSDIIDRAVLVERRISTIDLADFIVCGEEGGRSGQERSDDESVE
jgi:hypothetical protein